MIEIFGPPYELDELRHGARISIVTIWMWSRLCSKKNCWVILVLDHLVLGSKLFASNYSLHLNLTWIYLFEQGLNLRVFYMDWIKLVLHTIFRFDGSKRCFCGLGQDLVEASLLLVNTVVRVLMSAHSLIRLIAIYTLYFVYLFNLLLGI